jgi:2-oxoglutarate ferredoxin oxidoreductase subunit beta
LPSDYDPANWDAAIKAAETWGDSIPVGILYRQDRRPTFESQIPALKQGPLVGKGVDSKLLDEILKTYQ